MIGIYKITNIINGKCYIGQSKNIEQRFKEHQYHKQTIVGSEIELYGLENFKFEVLEECDEARLDQLEEYYIKKYDSIKKGYNRVQGGQHNKGESNANVSLTEQDIYNIRESYKNHKKRLDVYESYKDKITFLSFANIWNGASWQNVHMDVYTKENKQYYSKEATNGENSETALFTNNEVLKMRKRYINESAKDIYKDVADRCQFQTLQAILWGRSYKNIPIYSKKQKKWIEKRSL